MIITSLTGLLNLLISVALSLLTVVLAWIVAEKMYFQGLIGSTEMRTKRIELSSADYQKLTKRSSPLIAYLKKELYLLIRTPPYFINCVLTNVLVPVIILIPILIQSHNLKGPMPWAKSYF